MIFEMSARMGGRCSNGPVVFSRSLGGPVDLRPVSNAASGPGFLRQSLSSVGRYDAASLSPVRMTLRGFIDEIE
jgi:hypothetical protein